MKRAIFLLAMVFAGACTAPGPREADRYFVLAAASGPGASSPAAPRRDVLVAPTTASSFYDTQSIAFSREPGTRAYYQFNHWTERPQRAIHKRLAARLQGDARGSKLVLDTRLEEIYHDAASPPGTARVAIEAELVDAASRKLVARRTFVRSAPAASYDAAGAVQGFNAAVAAVVEDIAAWVGEQAGHADAATMPR